MPQTAAGPRTEPPVSVPTAAWHKRAATAAPEPLDEPPGRRFVFHGLSAGGHGRSQRGRRRRTRRWRACRPGCRRPRRACGSSWRRLSRTLSWSVREWAVVRTPATSTMSFSPYGMPWKGPRGPPRRISSSAAFARVSAMSAVTVMKTWIEGSRSRCGPGSPPSPRPATARGGDQARQLRDREIHDLRCSCDDRLHRAALPSVDTIGGGATLRARRRSARCRHGAARALSALAFAASSVLSPCVSRACLDFSQIWRVAVQNDGARLPAGREAADSIRKRRK